MRPKRPGYVLGRFLFRDVQALGLPFRDLSLPEESAPYFAFARMRLRKRVRVIGPWDEHCPQATHPWSGPAVPSAVGPVSCMKPQRKSAHEGRFEVTGRMGA